MVKYTIPLPYISLSGSDSQIYTSFEFCKGKFIFEKHIYLQSQEICIDNFIFKKSLHIWEDGAYSVQVDILTCTTYHAIV